MNASMFNLRNILRPKSKINTMIVSLDQLAALYDHWNELSMAEVDTIFEMFTTRSLITVLTRIERLNSVCPNPVVLPLF